MVNPLSNPVLNVSKEQRKKKYADLAIQNTNNSSIASKRSVEHIYLSKLFQLNAQQTTNNDEDNKFYEYFKFFVPKLINRSPCINRGYWLRLHAIRSRLDSVSGHLENPKTKLAIINLGCGFDPLPFQLLDKRNKTTESYHDRIFYLDIDYQDLLQNKIQVINDTEELLNIVGENTESVTSKSNYTSESYFARPCNLNDSEAFHKLITQSQLDLPFLYDDNVIKIFIAEVSLAYMKYELSNKIIQVTSRLKDSHFIMLEQLIPQGPMEPFSKQMLKHFKKNDSPLQTVTKYQDISLQIDRFNRLGYSSCIAGDMLQLWDSLDLNTKRSIESIQPFDELEEFHLFAHHYIILHAVNYLYSWKPYPFKDTNYLNTISQTAIQQTELIDIYKKYPHFKIELLPINLKRNFGSSSKYNDKLIYLGGCTPYRVNETSIIDTRTNEIEIITRKKGNAKIIPPRTCHTITNISNDEYIIIGGRNAPHKPFDDIWYYDVTEKKWENRFCLPQARFRHCSEKLSDNQILIYGGTAGSNNDTELDPFLVYNWKLNQFEDIVVKGQPVDCLVSSAMSYRTNTNKLVILGGHNQKYDTFSDKLMICQVEYDENEIAVEMIKEWQNPLFQRYGSKIDFIDDDHVILVGGTSPSGLFNENTTIIVVNIHTGSITYAPIPNDIWANKSLMFVGFDMELDPINQELVILGGAATCYGFGLVNNTSIRVRL